jgi:hypothetical protein
MTEDFLCECCGETFEKGCTDEEALDQSRETFGEFPPEELAIVCEDCYLKFMQKTGRTVQ